jgi:hypothetical protein
MMSMPAPEASLATSDVSPLRSRTIVDTGDLPHPPYRVPFLGDVVGLNPRTPFQSSLPQTKKLGPISARKMLGTEMVAVSGLDLVAGVHNESRFGKYVGHHLTPLREVSVTRSSPSRPTARIGSWHTTFSCRRSAARPCRATTRSCCERSARCWITGTAPPTPGAGSTSPLTRRGWLWNPSGGPDSATRSAPSTGAGRIRSSRP